VDSETGSGACAQFEAVHSADELELAFAASESRVEVLYLHDPFCPISRKALGQVERFNGHVYLIDVSTDRRLLDRVEARTGIRHESPQAFVLRRGKVRYAASHGAIRTEALREAAATAGGESHSQAPLP